MTSRLDLLLLLILVASSCTLTSSCTMASRQYSAEELAMREQKVRLLLMQGNKALRRGTWDGFEHAQAAYSTARELAPDDPRVLDGLGCVAWRKGNPNLAELYFKHAAELNPEYDRPVAHLALVAERRGHKRAALQLLRRAVASNPLNFHARNNYAALLLDNFQDGPALAEAQRELLKAYELAGPEDPIVDENLGLLKLRRGW